MAGVTAFLIVTALLSLLFRKRLETERRLKVLNAATRDYGDEELKKSFADRTLKPFGEKLANGFRRLAGRSDGGKTKSKGMQELEKQLRAADLPLSAAEFTLIKTGFTVLMLGVCLLVVRFVDVAANAKLMIAAVIMILCILVPKRFLTGRVKKRREAIVQELPDVMDLLVVSVEAGLGLDAAILRMYEKNRGVVAQELMGVVKNVQMGVPRRVAFKEMSDRCDVRELTAFATAMIQAEQLGVAVKTVLTTQAERLRVERRQRIQAKAQKAPVKMMLPTVGFIFPVMFIILLGPAAVNLIEVFK